MHTLQLPEAVRSYYQGPTAKGYMPVDFDAPPPEPLPTSSRYAHIESRIGASHRSTARTPELHTELRGGLQVSTDGQAAKARARSARLLAPIGQTAGVLQSVACLPPSAAPESPTRLASTSPSRAASARRGSHGVDAYLVHRSGPVGVGTSGAALARSERSGLSEAMSVAASTALGMGGASRVFSTQGSTAGASVGKGLRSARAASARSAHAAGGPLSPPRKPDTPATAAALNASAKYVAAMQGVISKVQAPGQHQQGYGQRAGSRYGRSGRSGRRPAPQEPQQVFVQVHLPSAPQQMLISSSKMVAGLLERVLMKEGYMRSDMLRILDQLKPFQRCGVVEVWGVEVWGRSDPWRRVVDTRHAVGRLKTGGVV